MKSKNWKMMLTAVSTVTLGATLAGCGTSQADLSIYSGRSQDLVEPIIERFEESSGLDVEVRYGPSTDLALTLGSEGERSPADVFFSQTPGAIGYLASRDLLTPVDASLAEQVDERYRDPENNWVGVTGRIRVLAYSPDRVEEGELPPSVFDLTGPEWEDRVAIAPTNASFQDFITAMRQERGEDETRQWLEAMRDNGAQIYSNNSDIVQAIARGEVDTGLVNHYYAYRLKSEDPGARVENYNFPEADLGSLLVSADVGLVRGSENTEAANQFIQFLLEEDAQRFFAEETFEYPLASGVEPAAELPELNSIATPEIELDSLGEDLEATEALIEESGLRRG
jgi:iron(III) transport system substrate-binding protein